MAAISSIALAVSAAGLAIQGTSAIMQANASRQATSASIRAENLREQQMRAESMRRQRETIRQSLVANAMARSRNVSQGAGVGSTSLFGAYGQTQGETGRQLSYTRENEDIGAGIFSANRDLAVAQGNVATYQGLGNLGASMTTNAMGIGKLGTSLFTGSNTQAIGPFTTTVRQG